MGVGNCYTPPSVRQPSWIALHLKVKALQCFEILGPAHSVTWNHIPETSVLRNTAVRTSDCILSYHSSIRFVPSWLQEVFKTHFALLHNREIQTVNGLKSVVCDPNTVEFKFDC